MDTLEITIQRKTEGYWPVVAEQNRPSNFLPIRSEGKFQLVLEDLLAQGTPLDYGKLLAQALFSGEIRDALIRSQADSQGDLRILLFIEDKELTVLRWERLCAPIAGDWEFLALNQNTIFSLYLPSMTDRRFPVIGRRDLRALVVAACPDGLNAYKLDAFDVPTTVNAIRNSLAEIPCDVLASAPGLDSLKLGIVGPATLDALCERLTAERYTLLHVVCHGYYDHRDGETSLFLADTNNKVNRIAATTFIRRLRTLGTTNTFPHFTFFATCESAAPEAEGAMGGIAQRLVRELGMPAVLAMTDRVSVTTAQKLATQFYSQLRKHGEVDRALTEACAGLADAPDIVVPALYNRLGGRPLFSDVLDPSRQLTDSEIIYGLDQMSALIPKRAPVLMDEFEKQARQLRGMLGAEKKALSPQARQERDQTEANIDALCTEAVDLSFKALALGQEPPVYDDRCPYLGLATFRADDRIFFFGREPLFAKLKTRLQQYPFLAVLGPSGSGKSSVVLACLIPTLQEENPGLGFLYMTPTQDPVTELHRVLNSTEIVSSGGRVLVVDQFEEVFTLCLDKARRRQFLDELCGIAFNSSNKESVATPSTTIILTMRADFWGDCAPYPILREQMQAHQELIAPMDAGELRSAMEQQARMVGLRFETDLANTILDEVQGEPGAMPLLQHALRELWLRRHGRWLRTSEYRDMGGVRQAIARTADGIYYDLTEDDRERMRTIFIRLTRLEDEEQGEEKRDTRRRVRLEDMVPAGQEMEITRRLVERLANARLVITNVRQADEHDPAVTEERAAEANYTEVEVAHEALIRYWPRLRDWLDENRHALRLRQSIEMDAAEWETGKRNESLLPRWNPRLQEALLLAQNPRFAFSQRELDYLNACSDLHNREILEEQKRQRELAEEQRKRAEAAEQLAEEQRKRAEDKEAAAIRLRERARIAIGVGIIATVLAAAAIMLFYQANQSEAAARQSEAAAKQGNSRSLAAQAEYLKETELDLALLLAVEAKHIADTFAAQSSLLSVATAKPGLLAFLPKHRDTVLDVEFSSDGRVAASAGDLDGTIALWDVLERTQIRRLIGPPYQAFRIVWHPKELILISADVKGNVTLWDISSDDVISSTLYTHPGSVRSLAISLPDGRYLASGSCTSPGWTHEDFCESGEIWIWDLKFQKLTTMLSVPFGSINDLAFSADGRLLASSSCANRDQFKNCNQGEIRLWNIEEGWSLMQTFVGHADAPLSLAFNPGNPNVLVSGGRGGMIVWDIVNNQNSREYPNPNNFVRSLRFSPDGKQLIGSLCGRFKTSIIFYPECVQGTIFVWGYPDDQPTSLLRELVGHTDWVTDIAIAPDGHTLLSGGRDQRLILWNSEVTQELVKTIVRQENAIKGAAISPDDKVLAVGKCTKAAIDRIHCLEGEVEIRDLIKDTVLNVLQVPAGGVQSVAFSPNQQANLLATGGCTLDEAGNCLTGEIHLWDLVQQQILGSPLQGHADFVQTLAFSPDGSKLATGGYDGTVILWDIETRRQLISPTKAFDNFIASLTFSTDGSLLAASSGDGLITLWNVTNGQIQDKLPLNGSNGVMVIAFSPDQTSNLLVSGARFQHPPTLWDLDSDEQQLLASDGRAVESLAFSRNGSMLATSNLEGVITLWDMASRRPIGELRIDPALGSASHLVFDSLGKWLVANTASAVVMWDVDVGAWEQHACQRANRERFTDAEWNKYFGSEEPHNVC